MNDLLQQAVEKQERARTFRKKGDALRKANREQLAVAAYDAGVAELLEARRLLNEHREQFSAANQRDSAAATATLRELVEVCGALGGMYQRLDAFDQALASYTDGSALEEQLQLPSTYNRLNAVKYALLTGQQRPSELLPKVRLIADLIARNLRTDKSMGDSGWALADLGDCLALLGRVDEASQTYAKFIAKAELKSPERALEVLKNIASRLQLSRDPDANRVQMAIDTLQANLVIS